jgi:hypothetical protein
LSPALKDIPWHDGDQHYQSELNEHNGFTFNSPSYRELGKRYAKEMIRLLKQPLFNPSSSVIPTKDLPNDWIIKSPSGKPFPIHWGYPPRSKIQYGYVLPDGYGEGGKSTLEWIKRNKARGHAGLTVVQAQRKYRLKSLAGYFSVIL